MLTKVKNKVSEPLIGAGINKSKSLVLLIKDRGIGDVKESCVHGIMVVAIKSTTYFAD